MSDIELDISAGNPNKAVIEGKTSVPFKTFVTLILQRKVQVLFKDAQNEPVIIGSELLTKLASAPDDKQEDRSKLVLVTLGTGVVFGVAFSAMLLLALSFFKIQPSQQDLMITIGVILGITVLVVALQSTQKKSGLRQKLYEAMEKATAMVSR